MRLFDMVEGYCGYVCASDSGRSGLNRQDVKAVADSVNVPVGVYLEALSSSISGVDDCATTERRSKKDGALNGNATYCI
jgi:hypothetical protein